MVCREASSEAAPCRQISWISKNSKRANVIHPLMISGDFFMSLMAAMGRPQLATGPQKCYKTWEEGKKRGKGYGGAMNRCNFLTLNNVNKWKSISSLHLQVHWVNSRMVNIEVWLLKCFRVSGQFPQRSPALESIWLFTKIPTNLQITTHCSI